jgi:hypothetical protein
MRAISKIVAVWATTGAFCLSFGAAAVLAAPTTSEILLSRPLVPMNTALFDPFYFPDAPPFQSINGQDLGEAQASQALDAYLAAEFPGDGSAQARAKSVFADPVAQTKIPSPSLRAALAALTGTIAEPAIDFILHAQVGGQPQVTDIRWADPSAFPNTSAVAEVKTVGSSGQFYIQFNNAYRGEDPFLFVSRMAHEPLHQDAQVANIEEATNNSFEGLIYLHQLVHHPELAAEGTHLSRSSNSKALPRLNSGTGTQLGLFASNGDMPIFGAGSIDKDTSWTKFFTNGDMTTTQGNALLGAYLANIHTSAGSPCPSQTFDQALLECIDKEGNGGLSDADLVAAANALALKTDVEATRSLTLKVKHRKLAGKVLSPAAFCRANVKVRLFTLKHGKAKKLGSAQTAASGSYSLQLNSGQSGPFRATIARQTIPGNGVCDESSAKDR